jgi:hypothetical protein
VTSGVSLYCGGQCRVVQKQMERKILKFHPENELQENHLDAYDVLKRQALLLPGEVQERHCPCVPHTDTERTSKTKSTTAEFNGELQNENHRP